MSSEFGVLQREQTIDYSFLDLSNRTQTLHRRARSLLTSIRTGSTTSLAGFRKTHSRTGSTSLADLRKTHLSGSRSESFADTKVGVHVRSESLEGDIKPKERNETTNRSHRRLRWTVEKDRQQISQEVEDEYFGLALSTTNQHCSNNPKAPPSFAGKRRTEQALRHYHRPTEINVEIINYREVPLSPIPTTPTRSHQSQKNSGDSSKSSRSLAFHGRPAEWSPALLSRDETIKEGISFVYENFVGSSSTLSVGSFHGKQKQFWQVSSLDEDSPTHLPFA